jgi:N-acetylglucosaminyldiphosphoundecaprenol N-acetyl-beta-D-mannosaminyltransferase
MIADTATARPFESVDVAGIPVANLTQQETLECIEGMISDGRPHFAAVVNAAKIVAAQADYILRNELQSADLVTADGMSVVWAARLLGHRLKERVTGIDLLELLVRRAAERGDPVYFLGAKHDSVRSLIERFAAEFPSLRVAGWRDGYFTEAENDAVVEDIRRSNARLLFVALGSPAQEHWIASNVERSGVCFAMGVGGSFDHLSGRIPRAPRWMQRAGLEWLHRLVREPGRLWRRYLIGNTRFVLIVARQLLSQRRSSRVA